MALFVEVESAEHNCKVIINLDNVIEVAPLVAGGCVLFFHDAASTNGKVAYKVKDSYDQFKQFAMQTISTEDITKRIDAIHKAAGTEPPKKKPSMKIPKFDGTVPDEE